MFDWRHRSLQSLWPANKIIKHIENDEWLVEVIKQEEVGGKEKKNKRVVHVYVVAR